MNALILHRVNECTIMQLLPLLLSSISDKTDVKFEVISPPVRKEMRESITLSLD